MSVTAIYGPCVVCGSDTWDHVYSGPVREGAFGTATEPTEVRACGGCGVWRLAETAAFAKDIYASDSYRAAMGQGMTAADFFAAHDAFQKFNMAGLEGVSLRGKAIADIGCGAGSFLDHAAGIGRRIVAIEPTPLYHDSLRSRGYTVYPFAADALGVEAGKLDVVTSFQVIEHVDDPTEFLADLAQLLAPGGRIVIATPNRDDILLKLLPDDFLPFYFRSAHRWYFDRASLEAAGRKAGLSVVSHRFIHSFGLGNTLAWLRDRRPMGNMPQPGIGPEMDMHWSAYLQATGQADNLYMTFERR